MSPVPWGGPRGRRSGCTGAGRLVGLPVVTGAELLELLIRVPERALLVRNAPSEAVRDAVEPCRVALLPVGQLLPAPVAVVAVLLVQILRRCQDPLLLVAKTGLEFLLEFLSKIRDWLVLCFCSGAVAVVVGVFCAAVFFLVVFVFFFFFLSAVVLNQPGRCSA